MKKFLTGVSAAALALAGAVMTAPAAQSTVSVPPPYQLVTNCPGGLVAGFPKYLTNSQGDQQGRLFLYYSSANGGTNCAKVYDDASGSHNMSVRMRRDDLSYQGSDSGYYSTYAGGVLVTSSNGKCIYVSGTLSMGSHSINQFRGSWGPVACG